MHELIGTVYAMCSWVQQWNLLPVRSLLYTSIVDLRTINLGNWSFVKWQKWMELLLKKFMTSCWSWRVPGAIRKHSISPVRCEWTLIHKHYCSRTLHLTITNAHRWQCWNLIFITDSFSSVLVSEIHRDIVVNSSTTLWHLYRPSVVSGFKGMRG